jgi:Rrf2 family protein
MSSRPFFRPTFRQEATVKLSRTSGYAIQVMLQLAEMEPGVPISCSHLATADHMPERYLLEVLRELVAHGLLHSARGSEGGFALARPADQITLREVFEVFDTPRLPFMPIIDGQTEVCAMVLDALQLGFNAAGAELQKLTIADLLCRRVSNDIPLCDCMELPHQQLSSEGPDDEVFTYVPPPLAGAF